MKMLVIVFRESLVEQVHALLNDYEVSAFSELHNVAGKGATGPTSQFFLAPMTNRMILTAVYAGLLLGSGLGCAGAGEAAVLRSRSIRKTG